ncbi:hypothetical protein [Clostridium perfringens]|uniref:hypothetical protein n=1 Tax=Clostridium perfringens TaxID=1502 RepID=UPI00096ABB21|nr:hypothetical protein [Clostridium perfringens]
MNKRQANKIFLEWARKKNYIIFETKNYVLIPNQHSFKGYLNDFINPFISLFKSVGYIILFPIDLIMMIYDLLPKWYRKD